jgi:hypothetical protein
MMLMKFLTFIPGHFSGWEWLALAVWIILGAVIGRHSERSERPA